jgi:hypothetical protein
VDHIPVAIWPTSTFGHPLREQLEQGEIQFDVTVRSIEKGLRLFPDDYIPFARITPGCMTLATMFGMEVILHVMLDNELSPEAILAAFSRMAETLAADVVGIPIWFVDDAWQDRDVTALY